MLVAVLVTIQEQVDWAVVVALVLQALPIQVVAVAHLYRTTAQTQLLLVGLEL